jgi:hypothetical protein
VRDEPRAGRRPIAGDGIHDARRNPDLGRELREAERGQRRGRIGLEHDGATGRERGRELPRRQHEWVVPRDDLRTDTDGFFERVGKERAAERVGPPRDRRDGRREEPEVLHALRELGLDGRQRLADVAGLELRQLLAVLVDGVGQSVQKAGALVRRRLRPRALERVARCGDCAVDVLGSRHRRLRQRSARRGLDQVSDLAGGGFDELPVDEQAVLAFRRDSHRQDDTSGRVWRNVARRRGAMGDARQGRRARSYWNRNTGAPEDAASRRSSVALRHS